MNLRAALAIALTLSTLGDAGWPSATAAPPDPNNLRFAAQLEHLINQYRSQRRISKLTSEQNLADLATEHSAAMAKAGRLGHDGFAARVRRSGYRLCVENVGWNYATPEAQMKGWQESAGHDVNLRDARVTAAGIGIAGAYVTFIACQ